MEPLVDPRGGHKFCGWTLNVIKFTLLHLPCETQRVWLLQPDPGPLNTTSTWRHSQKHRDIFLFIKCWCHFSPLTEWVFNAAVTTGWWYKMIYFFLPHFASLLVDFLLRNVQQTFDSFPVCEHDAIIWVKEEFSLWKMVISPFKCHSGRFGLLLLWEKVKPEGVGTVPPTKTAGASGNVLCRVMSCER